MCHLLAFLDDCHYVHVGSRGLVIKNVLPKVKPLLAGMEDIAEKEGKTLSQVALNWCITKGVIPIPGARNVRQAEDNCGALGWSLREEDMIRLNELSRATQVDLTTPLQGK